MDFTAQLEGQTKRGISSEWPYGQRPSKRVMIHVGVKFKVLGLADSRVHPDSQSSSDHREVHPLRRSLRIQAVQAPSAESLLLRRSQSCGRNQPHGSQLFPQQEIQCKNVLGNGIFLILEVPFGAISWTSAFSLRFCFLCSDFVKLLHSTAMFVCFALGDYAIIDYLRLPILFICVCF